MKQLTCAQMGGSCDTAVTGTTVEELMANGVEHVKQHHTFLYEALGYLSEGDKAKLNEKIKGLWDAAPEM